MCEICGSLWKHHSRCPYYKETRASCYCSVCGQGICNDEEYVRNDNGEYVHYDCIQGIRWLLDWLDRDVEIMDEE